MLACNIEFESPLWRDGMTAGLDVGIHLGRQCRQDEDCLHDHLAARDRGDGAGPYRRYLRAYYRQPLYPGIDTSCSATGSGAPMPQNWPVWPDSAGLTGRRASAYPATRKRPCAAPSCLHPARQAQLPIKPCSPPANPSIPPPNLIDGYIDAAIYCSTLVDECDLTPDEYIEGCLAADVLALAAGLSALRPALLRPLPAQQGQDSGAFYFPSPCPPEYWRRNVAALAAEMARCEAAGEGRSPTVARPVRVAAARAPRSCPQPRLAHAVRHGRRTGQARRMSRLA